MNICILANSLEDKYFFGGTFICKYLASAFRRLGHTVDLLEFNGNYSSLNQYDLIFTVDYAFDPTKVSTTTAFWSIDDPECYMTANNGYDYFFTHSEGSIELHEKIGRKNVYYLPFGYDESIFYYQELDKSFDVVYVGNGIESKTYDIMLKPAMEFCEANGYSFVIYGKYWNKRNNLMFRKYLRPPVLPPEVNEIYNKSKIIVNMHRVNQCNTKNSFIMRDYEARACKSFVLSDYFVGHEHFDAVVSDSPAKTFELLQYYLENDSERRKIADAGYKKVKDRTYVEVAKNILGVVS